MIIDNEYFRNGFRVLDAGGGARGAYYMSEQLNCSAFESAEIVYIDFSPLSASIAKEMIRIRRTSNVVWIVSWIEAIPFLGLGTFNLFSSTGVIHHLKNPSIGLKILREIIKPGGGGSMMVYSKIGRTEIYHMQHLFSMINMNIKNISTEISSAKQVLKNLNTNPWFHWRDDGDVETYDRYMHKRDIAFTVKSLEKWLAKNDFRIVDFALEKIRAGMAIDVMIPDNRLRDIMKKLNFNILHILDLFSGHIKMHEVYVSPSSSKLSKADLFAKDMTIACRGHVRFIDSFNETSFHYSEKNLLFYKGIIKRYVSESGQKSTSIYKVQGGTFNFAIPISNLTKYLFEANQIAKLRRLPLTPYQLIEEFKSKTKYKGSYQALRKEFREIFEYLENTGIFYLKHKSVGFFPKTEGYTKYKIYGIKS